MDGVIYGNTALEWGSALAVFLLVAAGVRLLTRLLVERLETLAKGTENDIDDLVAELARKTKLLFVLVVALWAGAMLLDLPSELDRALRALLVVALSLQGVLWVLGGVDYALERYRRRQLELDPSGATAVGALSFLARVAIWSVFLLLVLDNLGIDVTALIAGLGVGGIAVALALQRVLGDLFASLSIILDRPFVVGDFIIVGELMGTVEHVGLKTTRIRSLGGEQLVFGNSDLLSSRIRNYKRMDERRILFTLGVVYDTDYEQLEEIPRIIRQAVENQENTRFDRSHFQSYGDSALIFETVYYMLVPEYDAYMDVQEGINLEIFRRFGERGIEFAFPTRTLHVRTEGPAEPPPGLEPRRA